MRHGMFDVWFPRVLTFCAVLGVASVCAPVSAQDSAGSNTYIMSGISTGETLSKADGVISGSSGFTTTGVTGQNPNPQASGSNSYTMNPDTGGGSTAPVGAGSGDGGGGGGCFAGSVGSTGFPACAGLLAGLSVLGMALVRRKK